jgi:magnesium-transporting ATPase (P-type)
VYRLARLIKYSFYKNLALAFLLFYLQGFAGWSGQSVLDGITASFINAFFTAFPIGFFSVLDRPFKNLSTYMRFPKLYNLNNPLRARSFWKTGIIMGIAHGAAIFFIIYYSSVASGRDSTNDLYSAGKAMFVALIATVTAEIGLLARFWTWEFCLCAFFSYALVYVFLIVVPLIELGFNSYDITLLGVGVTMLPTPVFWFQQISVLAVTLGTRMLDRSLRSTFRPNDYEIVAEAENRAPADAGLGPASVARISALSVSAPLDRNGPAIEPTAAAAPRQNGLQKRQVESGGSDAAV